MQQATDKINACAEDWYVAINKDKSFRTLFTLFSSQRAGKVMTESTPLVDEGDEATYLGVTFDKKQTWKPQINRV